MSWLITSGSKGEEPCRCISDPVVILRHRPTHLSTPIVRSTAHGLLFSQCSLLRAACLFFSLFSLFLFFLFISFFSFSFYFFSSIPLLRLRVCICIRVFCVGVRYYFAVVCCLFDDDFFFCMFINTHTYIYIYVWCYMIGVRNYFAVVGCSFDDDLFF